MLFLEIIIIIIVVNKDTQINILMQKTKSVEHCRLNLL